MYSGFTVIYLGGQLLFRNVRRKADDDKAKKTATR
jgi:hypothetical protein